MESTIVITLLLAAAAGLVGFVAGRQRPRRADVERIAALEAELETQRTGAETREAELEGEIAAAKQRAEAAQTGVDEHFEASAELLARLAKDYRALFEHWADGAHRLGGSATRAEAIIEQARERLLVEAGGATGTDAAEADPAAGVDEAPAPTPPEPSEPPPAETDTAPLSGDGAPTPEGNDPEAPKEDDADASGETGPDTATRRT
jgi:uncharacterized membrane-anchored protein YhcB (DUF1043 family)